MRGKLAVLAATVGAFLLAAPSALAEHHDMVISEVFTGAAAADDDYVELQMYVTGQNLVALTHIESYDAAGTLVNDFEFPEDLPGTGPDQSNILIGDTAAAGMPDFTDPGLENAGVGGAVCFTSPFHGPIDCVSWGSFSGALPSPAGTPAPAPTPTIALHRSIAANCSRLLEGADDTDSSLADFFLAAPDPHNHGFSPSITPCPNTRFTKTPAKRTERRRATFRFTATPSADSFECKLDDRRFRSCSSPVTRRVRRGRHTFKVRAEDEVRAESYSWRVIRR